MTQFRVPDNSLGFEMADGTKYNAKNGVVEVDRPDHAAFIKKSYAAKGFAGGGLIMWSEKHYVDSRGWDCETCGYSAWGWQSKCPKCGDARITRE